MPIISRTGRFAFADQSVAQHHRSRATTPRAVCARLRVRLASGRKARIPRCSQPTPCNIDARLASLNFVHVVPFRTAREAHASQHADVGPDIRSGGRHHVSHCCGYHDLRLIARARSTHSARAMRGRTCVDLSAPRSAPPARSCAASLQKKRPATRKPRGACCSTQLDRFRQLPTLQRPITDRLAIEAFAAVGGEDRTRRAPQHGYVVLLTTLC